MVSNRDFLNGLVVDEAERLRRSMWKTLLCWSHFFPQMITLYAYQHSQLEANDATTSQTYRAWWNSEEIRPLILISALLAAVPIVCVSLFYLVFTRIQRSLIWQDLDAIVFAVFATVISIGIVSAVAASRKQIDTFIVAVILFTPSLYLIALFVISYAQRASYPPLWLMFLIYIPYGYATGTIDAMLPASRSRALVLLIHIAVVGAAMALFVFVIYTLACSVPWSVPDLIPGETSLACPKQQAYGYVFTRALLAGSAVGSATILGLLRLDDWWLSRRASRRETSKAGGNYLRHCSTWHGPRVSPIPDQDLSVSLRRSLIDDWPNGIRAAHQLLFWSNQARTVTTAINYVLRCFEDVRLEDEAFRRIRQLKIYERELALNGDENVVHFPLISGETEWRTQLFNSSDHRYLATMAAFDALAMHCVEGAEEYFRQGLRGERADEYCSLCSNIKDIQPEVGGEQLPLIDYGPDNSPNELAPVWAVVLQLRHCIVSLSGIRRMALNADEMELALGEIVYSVNDLDTQLRRLPQRYAIETPLLFDSYERLRESMEQEVVTYRYNVETGRIDVPPT